MADRDTRSYGPFAVGLMALHDRDFFERLLTNPRKAMTDMVNQGDLTLTGADMDEVVRLIESSHRPLTPAEGLAIFDRWHETGHVRQGDWVDIRGDWVTGK